MAEHQQRYLPFLEYLTERGVCCYMHDMASHGASSHDTVETGWFGEKEGWKGLVEDFHTVIRTAGKENPDLPLLVMGHSMGSFICRAWCAMHPETAPAGAIFMGSGGPNPAAGAGKAMASLIGLLRGKKFKSELLNRMAFGSYNKRFEGRTPYDWLTRDQEIVDRYIEDPLCGFLFTVQGMHDLVSVNAWVNGPEWYEKLPKELPILLTSGAEDPVGDYGEGIRKVAEELKRTGHTKVTVQLYPGCRHEILNEKNREQVMEDLVKWMEGCL
jgi:alpha-beta hydrolase superfamily lysophospholipase